MGLFNDIADAIREKTGTSNHIIANNFPSEILNIPASISKSWDLEAWVTRNIATEWNMSSANCIGSYTFAYCYSLTTISFLNCNYIGAGAFYNCYKLISAIFPEVFQVTFRTFGYCSNLTTISFPNCSSIGSYAFYYCSNLITISFPNCSYISSNAFYNCRKLISAYFLTSTIPSLANINAFYNTPISISTLTGSFGSIYVLSSMVDSFKTATNWTIYSDRIVAYTG